MKKLLTSGTDGLLKYGPEYLNNHLRWLQDAQVDIMKAIFGGLDVSGNTSYIVSGVKKTVVGSNDVYSEGFIWMNGAKELMYCAGGTFPNGTAVKWNLSLAYPLGTIRFSDGTPRLFHAEKTAVLDDGLGGEVLSTTKRLDSLLVFNEDWITVADASPDFQNGWDNTNTTQRLAYRENAGMLEFRGRIGGGTAVGGFYNNIAFIVPTAFRPTIARFTTASGWTNGSNHEPMGMTIATNGNMAIRGVSVHPGTGENITFISFDGVRVSL